MGEVYRAVHATSGEPYAIKALQPFFSSDHTFVERFRREAQIATEIDSPHVVRVLESGVLEDGSPWFAMDLLEGRSLSDILRERVRLSLSETADLVAEVSRGLAATHAAGIVHRDIKPQNLFLAEGESGSVWKILDFGVSGLNHGDSTLTRGAMVGTPSYMSPEQTRGQKADSRADIFGLGVVAYRALTGRPAFTGNDDMHTMYNIAHRMPVRPGRLVAIPEDVERALAIALAKEREDRYESAAKFASALLAAAHTQLSPSLRDAADRLLSVLPWGAEFEDTPGSQPTRH
jgi:serine/threonine-protein kinase